MEKFNIIRMKENGNVSCDYGWGDKDWMINMVIGEIVWCENGEYVKVVRKEEDDWEDEEVEEDEEGY